MPVNVRPFQSGNRARSRGRLAITPVFASGSTLTTSSVSVRAWVLVGEESIPVRRTVTRESAVAGVAIGLAAPIGSTAVSSGDMPGEVSGPVVGSGTSPPPPPTKILVPAS